MSRFVALGLVLLAVAACLVRPAGAVMGGVLQFTQNGSPVQTSFYQVALGSSGTVLWAVAPGGVLYQINATTMQYMNSTTFTAPSCSGSVVPGTPTCLFVDDTHSRVYACFAPAVGSCMSLFIVNSLTTGVLARVSFSPAQNFGTVYNLPLSQHAYDSNSRMFASVAYLPNNANQEIGFNLYNVSSDSFASISAYAPEGATYILTGIGGIQYTSATDALTLWAYDLTAVAFNNVLLSATGASSPSSFQSYNLNPFYANASVAISGKFVNGPLTLLPSYDYAVFASTTFPSQGSYLLQFTNPILPSGAYTPKSAVAFPTQPLLLAVALDETAISSSAGVLFLSTNNGQLLKYRYSDPGGGTSMSVTTPNYNGDTQVSSANPSFSYQTYSKTTQAIYLSSSAPSGGIWRVPFYDCGAAASCSSCAALNDPYCGWCPLSGACTTNASCATGELVHTTNSLRFTQHKRPPHATFILFAVMLYKWPKSPLAGLAFSG
jgi:hypothetical protein